MANKNTKVKNRVNRIVVRTKKQSVISTSPRRNMQEVVYVNENADGSKFSITRHEPIDTRRPVRPANHAYLKGGYKQPRTVAA